ncbi:MULTISPECIES: hypothetical protein [Oxalobacteraceae]|uniref:hypothetical protein n=1 Tax=Oxalobacteraceae TaxID=75682 RepID=UPI000710B7EF|nr:hypothetical protein [Noviherbaspirillum sp. Root189]KRB83868.1 hypothetical protein ASE07_23390 [Noviherbaspirillum sp. Root189]
MTQDEILDIFRQEADKIPSETAPLNDVILALAQLLADSRGKLSKENFEVLSKIGGVLYKEGKIQFNAKSDVDTIMKLSSDQHRAE